MWQLWVNTGDKTFNGENSRKINAPISVVPLEHTAVTLKKKLSCKQQEEFLKLPRQLLNKSQVFTVGLTKNLYAFKFPNSLTQAKYLSSGFAFGKM